MPSPPPIPAATAAADPSANPTAPPVNGETDRRFLTEALAGLGPSITMPSPAMATAAKHTVASVFEIRQLGELDPEAIVTPGIFVSRIVKIPRVATQAGGFRKDA